MPLYPFILLAAIFLAVMILPPLIAAYLDHRRESRRQEAGHEAGRHDVENRESAPSETKSPTRKEG
jgi:NADH:ubiquinone oxidoreductase subunit 3 (subunit A)